MYATPMDVINVLRTHIQSSTLFINRQTFLKVLKTVEDDLSQYQYDSQSTNIVRCINLEGLDGVGKTTVANHLTQQSEFSLMKSIPDELQSFRGYFDEQDEDVKRRYYTLCNIIVSNRLLTTSNSIVWILDRYWPSTIAYRFAHQDEIDLATIPNIIPWPKYLVRPSHIFYLHLDEKKRRERIAKRNCEEGSVPEEERLASDHQFRQRLQTIYHCIENIHLINTDNTINQIIEQILQHFRTS